MLYFLLIASLMWGSSARDADAQAYVVVATCGALPSTPSIGSANGPIAIDQTGKLCTNAGGGAPYQFTSAGAGQYALAITTVQTLTVPAGSLIAEICVETASARYTTTGTTPSSTVGVPVAAGGCFQLAGVADLTALKIIGAGATTTVEYFK